MYFDLQGTLLFQQKLGMPYTIRLFKTILGMYGDYVVYGNLQGTLLFQGQSWECSVQNKECSVQ